MNLGKIPQSKIHTKYLAPHHQNVIRKENYSNQTQRKTLYECFKRGITLLDSKMEMNVESHLKGIPLIQTVLLQSNLYPNPVIPRVPIMLPTWYISLIFLNQ